MIDKGQWKEAWRFPFRKEDRLAQCFCLFIHVLFSAPSSSLTSMMQSGRGKPALVKSPKHNGLHCMSENETFVPELNDEIRIILICYIRKGAEISYSRDNKTKT